MLERVLVGKEVDIANTFFIGDDLRDVEAGKKMGMKTILVLSGKTSLEKVEGSEAKPDYIKKDLSEAVNFILKGEKEEHA